MRRAIFFLLAACTTHPTQPVVSETACAGCHAAEVAQWRESIHRASFTSADFQRSYRVEPLPYCVGCHAPLADAAAGIGCAACHGNTAAHVAHRARTAKVSCAGCHDFDAPGSNAILQSTAREHDTGPFATTPCPTCHMPRKDHRFAVTRNPDFLRRAIRVSNAHFENGNLTLRVASNGVGHRFPTGDLFRRVTVTVTAANGEQALVAGDTFFFARDWDRHRAMLHAKEPEPVGDDTRLDATPRELRIACPSRPARVHVTIVYERGAGAVGESFDAFASLPLFDADVTLD